jgi:hypothetical protein
LLLKRNNSYYIFLNGLIYMKKIIFLPLIVVFAISGNAQTPNWMWGQCGGGGTYSGGMGVGVSQSGHLYLGARFAQTCTFGTVTATGPGANNVLHGRFDTAGVATCKWLSPDNFTNGEDYVYDFTIDNRENTYLTGTTNSGDNGWYVDKYDSSGNKKWALNPPNTTGQSIQMPSGYAVAVDGSNDSNNVFVVGEYSNSITIGSTILTSVGSDDIFLTKIDSNGNPIWAVSAGGPGLDGGRGIAIDPQGYIYICGSYNGTATFGTLTTPPSSGTYPSLFVAKYDRSGNAIWVNTATNSGFYTAEQFWRFETMKVDSCGNGFVTGTYYNTAQFGNKSITSLSGGNGNIYVAKILTNGNWEWVKSAGGTGSDGGQSVALDKYSDVYVSGSINSRTATFGSISVTNTSSASSTAFVAKYSNSSGDAQWVLTQGGSGGSGSQGLTVDDHLYVYMSGSISGTCTFGPSTITSGGGGSNSNILLTKIDTVPMRAIIPHVSPNYCPGSTVSLPYTIIGTFNPGNIFTAQLSDSTGSFANAVNIGDTSLSTGGSIIITIPSGTPAGTTYLIRVVSSNPATSSYVNGCGAYFQNNVYIDNFYITIGAGGNLPALITANPGPSICNGLSVTLTASGGHTYLWSNNSSTDSVITVSPIADSTFTVLVTQGSCQKDTSITITVGTTSLVNITPQSPSTCNGADVTLSVPVVSGTTYTWSPSTTLSSSTGDTVVASPSITTTYSVSGSNSGGCSSSGTDIVSVGPAPPFNFTSASSPSTCAGEGIILTVPTSGSGYEWSPAATVSPDTGNTVTATPLEQTTYTVTGRDNLGCFVTAYDTVYITKGVNKPTITDTDNVLTSSATQSNQWYVNGNKINGATGRIYNASAAGCYWTVATNLANGCSSISDTICVTGINRLSINANLLSIYPNPTGGELFVNISPSVADVKDWNLQITDVLGRMVYNRLSLNYSNDIDLSNLPEGVYFIIVIDKSERAVVPIIRQNY